MLPFQKAIDSLFKKCGQLGKYKGRKVLFLIYEPDMLVGVGFAQAHSPTCTLKLRISDAPKLKIGDKIVTEDKIYLIKTEPVQDSHGLIWSVDLLCD